MIEPKASKRELEQPIVTIERAVPDDAEAIMRIKRARWMDTYVSEEYGVTPEDMYKKFSDQELSRGIENWQKGLAADAETNNDKRTVFVAKTNSKVVGYTSPFIESDGQRRLGGLYVAADSQNLGIGTGLLKKALAWHGDNNDVYLHVVSYNQHAISFYEHFGFERTGVEMQEDFDKDQGIKHLPEIEMVHKASN